MSTARSARDRLRPSPRGGLRVCIITTRNVGDNPRVVKEADALTAAGHTVRVIAFRSPEGPARRRDEATMRGKQWRLQEIEVARGGALQTLRWLTRSLRERQARQLLRAGFEARRLFDAAISKHATALWRSAITEPADLVIAHHASALPPAARTADTLSAHLAFDAEDLHAEELPDIKRHALDRSIVVATERRYLPRCDRVTASSPGIADALVERYQIARPEIILNAFPVEELAPPPVARPHAAPISLYWFSQTIGLDRGIQDVLRAMPLVRQPVVLHLRGSMSEEVRIALVALATELEIIGAVHFHPLALPPDLVALAAEHDIGLALESPVTLNRRLCITNKLLLYFAAGIPVVATDTPGQRWVIESADGGGLLYRSGDHMALADAINSLTQSRETLASAKAKAASLGRGVFSWDQQASRLIEYLTGDQQLQRAGLSESGAAT